MLVFTWSGYVALPKKEWLNLSLWFYQVSWVYCKRLPVEFRDMACDHSSVITEMGRQACEFSESFENSVPESWKKKNNIFSIWRKMKRKQEEGGRGRGVRGHAMNLTYYFIEIYFHLVYADFISGWLDLALQSNT